MAPEMGLPVTGRIGAVMFMFRKQKHKSTRFKLIPPSILGNGVATGIAQQKHCGTELPTGVIGMVNRYKSPG